MDTAAQGRSDLEWRKQFMGLLVRRV